MGFNSGFKGLMTNINYSGYIVLTTFVNRCLRYILRIWWPNIISNKDLWKVTGQEDINLEIRKRKFRWIGPTLREEDGEIPKAALL